MFNGGLCGTDGPLGLEMEETCRTTCYDTHGCLPPCESDHTNRRRSQFSCQRLFDEGFCGVDGVLGQEAAETCRTTCADYVGCYQAPTQQFAVTADYTAYETIPSGATSSDLMSSIVYKDAKATGLSAALGVSLSNITITGFTVNARRLSAVVRQLSAAVSVTTHFTVQAEDESGAEDLSTTIAAAAVAITTHTVIAMTAADWSGESVITSAPTMTASSVGTPTVIVVSTDDDANDDTTTMVEPLESGQDAVASNSPQDFSWERGVLLPLGVLLICCCCVCIFARMCRASRTKGQGEPLTSSGADTAIEREEQAEPVEPTLASKSGPSEGTPAGGAATSIDAVVVSVREEEGVDDPDPEVGAGQLKKKKKRVKKTSRAVSFNPEDQAKVIDDADGEDDDEEEKRPECPQCNQYMVWSDYGGPPYNTKYGWGCKNRNTCHNWKENSGSYRWNCRQCSEDLCEQCSGLRAPAPAKRGVISMWQPKDQTRAAEDPKDLEADDRPGADALARGRSAGSILHGEGGGGQGEPQEAAPERRSFFASILSRRQEPEGPEEQQEQQEAPAERRTFASIFSRSEAPEGQEEPQEDAGKRRTFFASIFTNKDPGPGERPRTAQTQRAGRHPAGQQDRGGDAGSHFVQPGVRASRACRRGRRGQPGPMGEPGESEQQRRPSSDSSGSASSSSASARKE
ncbi:unnamed protein product [Prorocentrum cordatum]|uniref:Uncharacterized protein n=1 Tax=Prorocentrum cordatum TaxID=2364126 RepID=A0ABN9XIT6_9DINO|nr:unnamed protein product [Polarella glacialis]